MSRRMHWMLTVPILFVAAGPAAAEHWPGWRGPRGDGTSDETNVPTRWSAGDNVKWKVEVPGVGHASPIVWGERIFLVACLTDTHERVLICLDRRTGQTLWRKTVLTSKLEHKHRLNSWASSTPVTDGKRVFVSFLDEGKMFVAAYDFDGNQLWAVRPGAFSSVHGYCSSPVLYKDSVIINGDHDGDSYLLALNQANGKVKWKTPRANRTRSYCTPIIRQIDGRTQMILSGDKSVASYDPDDGSPHWIIDGPTEQFVASVVYNGELLFMTCGFPQEHVMAIKPGGKGNVTRSHVAWHHETKDAAYVPSPIAAGRYFLVADDFGTCTCYDAATGETLWREKLARHFSASLASANGLVYFTADQGLDRGEQGVTYIVRPGPTLDIIARNVLGEPVYASPAISEGCIYLRGDKHLFCIGG